MNIKSGTRELEKILGKLTFARVIRAYRLGEELSQVEMAKILKISKQSLNDLEKGRTLPSIERAADIAKKIGMMESMYVTYAIQDHINRAKLNYEVKLQEKPNKAS